MKYLFGIAALTIVALAGAEAQDTSALLRGAILPTARPAPAPEAVSTMTFAVPMEWVMLSTGQIIVHERAARSVVLVDASLTQQTVIFDGKMPPPLGYPTFGPTRLLRARGDTAYFLDVNAHGFRVISPEGKVVRREYLDDLANVAGIGAAGTTLHVDPHGRIIFSEVARRLTSDPSPTRPLPESTLIMRTRSGQKGRDTVAVVFHRIAEIRDMRTVPSDTPGGRSRTVGVQRTPVFDVGDAWTMTSSGRFAILRASDLHADWMEPDGKWAATPPPPWVRMVIPPDVKQQILELARRNAATMPQTTTGGGNVAPGVQLTTVVDDSIPDLWPAFAPTALARDPSGGFWVNTVARSMGRRMAGPTVYALFDAAGKVTDRVMFPAGRTLAGVGNGFVMLVVPSGPTVRFERVAFKR